MHFRLKDSSRDFVIVFGVAAGYWLMYLAAYWPGVFGRDAVYYLETLSTLSPGTCAPSWESTLYACYLTVIGHSGRVALVALQQIILAAFVIAYAHHVLRRKLEAGVAATIAVALTICLPVNGFMLSFIERDVSFAWLAILLFFQIVDFPARPRPAGWWRVVALTATVGLLAAYRKDGLVFALLLPFQIRRARLLAPLAASLVVFVLLIPALAGSAQSLTGGSYNYNAYMNPLAYILKHAPGAPTAGERQVLEELLYYDQVVAQQKDDDFSISTTKGEIGDADRRRLMFTAAKIFIRHPLLFLENRWTMWSLTAQADFAGGVLTEPDPGQREIIERFGLVDRSVWPALSEYAVRAKNLSYEGFPSDIFWRPRWPLLICAAVLLLAPLWPQTFVWSAGILAHLSVVLLTQPAPKAKYTYAAFLFAWLIFPVAWRELRRRCPAPRGWTTAAVWKVWAERIDRQVLKLKPGLRGGVKPYVLGALKLSLSVALFWALVRSGRQALTVWPRTEGFAQILVVVFIVHLVVTALTSWRWGLLVEKAAGRRVGAAALFFVSWASQFAGLVLFGLVGSDLVRALYLVKVRRLSPSAAVSSVFMDRMFSFISLALLLVVLIFMRNIGAAGIAAAAFFWLVPRRYRVVNAIGVTAHLLKALMVLWVANAAGLDFLAGIHSLMRISFGLLVELVPVSWEGLGVGHWSFSWLLQEGGAETYNRYFLGKLFFKLSGALALVMLYSSHRRRAGSELRKPGQS